jgi:hypothetical protein
MICESATAGFVSSAVGAGKVGSLDKSAAAALPSGQNSGENSGEITSRKAINKLALRCRGLNLWVLILFISANATIVGRWGVCAAFQTVDFAKTQTNSFSFSPSATAMPFHGPI